MANCLQIPIPEGDGSAPDVAGLVLRLESLIDSLKERLKGEVEKNGPIEVGGEVFDFHPKSVWDYDVRAVVGYLDSIGKDPYEYPNVDGRKLKKLLSGDTGDVLRPLGKGKRNQVFHPQGGRKRRCVRKVLKGASPEVPSPFTKSEEGDTIKRNKRQKGTLMSCEERVQSWLEIAAEDLDVAHLCHQNQKYLYAAYLCQQSIEKALKAVIEAGGNIPPPIHHLQRLAQIAGVWDVLSGSQKDFIRKMTAYAIEARYPDRRKKLSISVESAGPMLSSTMEVFEWLRAETQRLLHETQ